MPYRIQAEISEIAFRKLMAEQRRRTLQEGRGKRTYPIWKIVQDLLMTLPEPEVENEPVKEAAYAHR